MTPVDILLTTCTIVGGLAILCLCGFFALIARDVLRDRHAQRAERECWEHAGELVTVHVAERSSLRLVSPCDGARVYHFTPRNRGDAA